MLTRSLFNAVSFKTIIISNDFTYYNRVRIYTRNQLKLPTVKYREWAQVNQSDVA